MLTKLLFLAVVTLSVIMIILKVSTCERLSNVVGLDQHGAVNKYFIFFQLSTGKWKMLLKIVLFILVFCCC